MARVLYTSWISTFARKAALALELKGLEYEAVDGLSHEHKAELRRLNPRAEVPVLVDDGIVVVNSSDILQYLEHRYPSPPLLPERFDDRVLARALERLGDQRFDPIVVDCTLWQWANRADAPPPGFIEAGQADLEATFSRLEAELSVRPNPWPFGAPGVVECAWFPNLIAAQPLGFKIDADRFPSILRWLAAMRAHPVFTHDRRRTARFLKQLATENNYERSRIFWSGERLEWLFSKGFHEWFAREIAAGRVAFPD